MTDLSQSSISLLVVDDDAVDRAAVRRAMRAPGLSVTITEAHDAAAAFEALQTGQFDCVLLDYRLPRGDGLSVLQSARGQGLRTPIIVLTGQGDEQLAVEIMKAGATDYLPKSGLVPERLRQAVLQAVRVRRAEVMAEAERRRVARLQGFMAALAGTRTVPEVAHAIMTQGLEAFHAVRGVLAVAADAGQELEVLRADGYPDDVMATWRRIPLDAELPLAHAYTSGESAYFESAAEILARYPDLTPHRPLLDSATVVLPLTAGAHVVGVVSLSYGELHRFDDDHRRDLGTFARVCAQALERAQLFELANRERRRAEEASRLKDEFLAVVSHELRTPLNAILGWATMLRGGKLEPERALRAAEVIERNARSQAQLIEDLLDVSRIISGKMRIELAPVEVAQVLEAALELARPTAETKGVTLHLSCTREQAPQRGDAERLRQVFWNLLSNAIKFTPAGGSVRVRLAWADGSCVVEVEDTGTGIAPEFLPHVFERFRQEDTGTTRKAGGLGLGLAIVRHIVELHHGSVAVQSAGAGMGSTFVVRLPAGSGPEAAPCGSTASGPPDDAIRCAELASSQALLGLHILVVDDEEDARDLLVSILTSCGAEVSTATCAPEAMTKLQTERPDLLVSDLGMPEEDGYSLIERVRALPPEQGGSTPAVALSAYARREDRARALLSGFTDHAAKPVEPSELVRCLASLAPPSASQ